MDSDGFTLNFSNGASSGQTAHYLAIGGSDLTGYTIGTFALPTSTGSSALISGLGYQPEALILAGGRAATETALGAMSLGFVTAASEEFALCVTDDEVGNGVATIVSQHQRSDCCITGPDGTTPATEDFRLDFTQFDSGGATFNCSNAAAAGHPWIYAALAGGQYKVGTDTQKTSTGTQAKDVGFTPTGVLFAGCNAAANSSVDDTQHKLSIGASDGTNEGFFWTQMVDNVNPSQLANRSITTKAFGHSTADSTTDAEADCSFSGNTYVLNWTTVNEATAKEFGFLAMGSNPAAASGYKHRGLPLLGVG
jgi:hypothetical protein